MAITLIDGIEVVEYDQGAAFWAEWLALTPFNAPGPYYVYTYSGNPVTIH